MYQTRQHEPYVPIEDNEWEDVEEDTVRKYLGSSSGVGQFHIYDNDMRQGKIVTYCGLIDFRWKE